MAFRGVGADTYSNIFVDNVAVPNLGVSDSIPLVVGHNKIEIVVHSSNGIYANTYTVQVQRLEQRTAKILEGITVSDADGSTYTLNPSFASGTLSYSLMESVPFHISALSVGITHTDKYGIVKASVAADKSDEVEIGDHVNLQSRDLNLGVGSNTLTLISFAQDRGVSQTYSISATRLTASAENTFSSIEITTGRGTVLALSPAFSPSTTTYSASVRYTDTFSIALATSNQRATYTGPDGVVRTHTGTYSTSLAVGVTVLEFILTAQDSTTQSTYTINLTREKASADARLGNIETKACDDVNQALVEPTFDKDTDTYTAKVYSECSASGESDAMGAQYVSLKPTCFDTLCSSIRIYEPKGNRWIAATAGAYTTLELNGNPLSDTTNAILIEVTAEDDVVGVSTKKAYTVNAIRQQKDNNANLISLVVNNAVTDGYPLSGVLHRNTGDDVLPAFDKTHHEYWMEVENSVATVTITAQTESQFAILKVGTLSPVTLSTVANNTESQALSLPAGTTTTLTIEVLSGRYQPNESVEGYDASTSTAGTNGSGSRIINYIHVFRRMKSTDASLSALTFQVDGPNTGVVTAFSPTFTTATTEGYTMTVRYYISKMNITATCPDTAGPVSYKHHTPRCNIEISPHITINGFTQYELSHGESVINVQVTAEDGSTRKTYTVRVTRQVFQTDSSLKSLSVSCAPLPTKIPPLYQTVVDSTVSGCWLSASAAGGDPSVAGYDSAFDPSVLTYYVRAQHRYSYHNAVVSPYFQNITFTAQVNSTVDSLPVATMTVGGAALADGVESSALSLLDATSSDFPTPKTTQFNLKVTAEDGSSRTYVINVFKAALEPSASDFVKYYQVDSYDNKTANIVAGTKVPFNLEVNNDQWNTDVASKVSSLNLVYDPIVAMAFEEVVTLNGSVAYPASTYSLPLGGRCASGLSCIDYYCVYANGTTTTTKCEKSIPLEFIPKNVGSYIYKVQAYTQLVGLKGAAGNSVSFNVIHAAMSMNYTKIVYPTDGLVGYVSQPGTEKVLLQAYDIFGNIILDTRATYAPSQMEALVCPPDTVATNTSSTPAAPPPPGFEGYCRCGQSTSCTVPSMGTYTQNSNGTYTLEVMTLVTGTNKIYMTADFDGLPLNGGPGSDYFGTYPVPFAVSTNPIGTRSKLVFNTSTKPYVSFPSEMNETQIPYFHVSAYDGYSNKISTGGDMSRISLGFEPSLTSGFNMSDEGNGLYKVLVNTTTAAAYKVSLYINGALSVASPFTFQIYSGNFSSKSFADYPDQSLAGIKKDFLVYPRDWFGNAIEYNSPHGSVADRLKLEVTNIDTNAVTLNAQEFVWQTDGTYLCNFTAPTNAFSNYYLDVHFLNETDATSKLFKLPAQTSNILDILGSYPNPAKSQYFVTDNQKAGAVILGVVGIDDYGNRSPHFWSRWSASLDLVAAEGALNLGLVTALATSGIYNISEGGSVQIPFGVSVNISGSYEVKFYYDGNPVDGVPITATTVLPADIGMYSTVSTIPETTSLGQLVTVDIGSYDSFNNKISTGGQGDLMEIKIYKQSDFTDTVTYSIIDNGDGSYQVKFSPERSGIYVFEVKYKSDGKAFTQTFDVKFEFALPEHFEAILPSKFDAGVEATVVVQPIQGVDIAAAAKSVIIAQLREANSSTSTNLTVSTADAEGKRSFKVLETKSGDYFIDIFLEGKHVGSSPYNVTILPGPIFSTKVVPMAQTTYYSDDTIELTLELYDTYNNSALVDIANDISVKYYQLPEGLIVEADVTKTSHGYVAATKLTLAAIYKVQIIIKGIQICVEGEAECTPSVTILPGEVNALTSLLEGNGLGNTIAAGIEGNVRVVPLDTYSNLAQESKSQLMDYTLNIFSAANSSQVGSPLSLVFSALDASHAVSYVLTEAGKYQMQVVQQDNATVSGKMVDVEVLPSEVLVSNTEIEVGTQTVAVGSAGSIRVTLKDQYENIIQKDLGTEVGVVLTNPSKVLSSAAGDVSLTFASGTYDATFSTTAAGEYAVSVEIYGISVRSNTTVTFVPEVPYALATIARLAGNGLGIAGQKNILYIDGKDKYGNARTQEGGNYTVEVSVPDGTSTKKLFPSEISLFWNAQGMIPFYQVEFVSEPKGLTWVTVELDGLPVVGSPFSITVSPGPIDPEKCVLSGPGTTGGILNQQTFFEIQSMDSFGNERTVGGDKFEISLKGTNSQSTTVAVAVTDLNNVKYDVRYILNSLGTFTLEVKLGLQDVGLLPVRSPLVVSSKNTAGTINVIMSQVFGLSPAIAAGDQLTITIIALDSEGFQLTTGGENFVASVWLTGLSQFKTEFQSVDLLNGTYLIEYERSVKGNYELELHHVASDTGVKTFVGTKVLNYPYQVECIPGLTMAEESYILPPGIPATVPAGTFQSIYVQSMDKFKNRQSHRDGVEDMWSITGSRVDSPVPLAVASTRTKSGSTGLYELAFKLPDIGVYNVSVQLTNQTGVYLVGSSALVEGIPGGLAPSKVYTLDTGKMASVVGNVTEISFLPRDISGNVIPSLSTVPNCTVTLEPAVGQRTSSCEYRSSVNSFFASYSATKSGAKSLSILLNGEHILGSPFAFTIEPGTPASATAAGIDFSGVQVNEKLSPTITLADQYGNKILNGDAEVTVEVVGIFNTGVLRFEGFMENYGNGTYRVQVQVQSAGSFQFYVSDETSVLLNSTLTVNPLPTSAASSYLSPSANFDGNKFQVEAGSIIEANIIAIAEDGNQQQGVVDAFSVSIDPDSAYLASVIDSSAVSTSTSGKYSFRFQTKRVLSTGYLLSVKLGGSDVKGSPFPVTVGPGEPQAVQSNIYSGDYAYDASLGDFGSVAGIGRKFLLQLRDDYGNDLDQEAASASGNKLSIKVDGVSNVTTAVVGLPDGRYEMFYSVTKAGSFFLQAQLSGVNVGGGSSILVVAGDNDFSMFNVYGPGISSDATVGYTYHFNIEARDMFGNTRQDDGSTLNLISVLMVSRTTDRDTGAVVDTNFELVQVKYESAASTSESSETWSAGSFRVMFKTTVAGEIRATISACPQGGMTCSHIESDLDRYNVQAQAIGTSPYSAQSALSRGMSATTLSGVGLQGGVITSSDTSEFVDTGPLPIVIEPRDLYGNIVALDPSESSNFEVSVEASSSTIIDSMLGEMGIGGTTGDTNVVISNVVAVEGNQGFTFNLTAAGVGDYFMDIKYKGSLLTANSVLITVYSSYPH